MALSQIIRNRIASEIGENIPTNWRDILHWRIDLVGAQKLGKVWFHYVDGQWLPAITMESNPTLYTGDDLVERVVHAWIARYREVTGRII